jgi:signal transduction histidine kinase
MERDKARQTALQQLLIKIASTYINIELEKVDDAINESLQEMAEFVGADRAYIFEYDIDSDQSTNTYEWHTSEIPSEKENLQKIPLERIRPLARNHAMGQPFYLNDVQALNRAEESNLKNILTNQGVQSIITVPMINEDELIGFVGFESLIHKKTYSEADLAILTIFANMLVNVKKRIQKESKLHSLLQISDDQNDRLKNFAHILSYNVRSHASNISMILDLIYNEYPELAELDLIELLSNSADNLASTLSQLNEVVQINTSAKGHLEVLNLNEILERSIDNVSPLTAKKQVRIINMIMDRFEVYGISSYIENIFNNILTNAVKYASDERDSYVKLYCLVQGKYVVLCFEDNGVGIDLEKQEFDIFGISTSFNNKSGDGNTGLFITKNQVEAIGGRIEVESTIDKGSTFKIFLRYEEN